MKVIQPSIKRTNAAFLARLKVLSKQIPELADFATNQIPECTRVAKLCEPSFGRMLDCCHFLYPSLDYSFEEAKETFTQAITSFETMFLSCSQGGDFRILYTFFHDHFIEPHCDIIYNFSMQGSGSDDFEQTRAMQLNIPIGNVLLEAISHCYKHLRNKLSVKDPFKEKLQGDLAHMLAKLHLVQHEYSQDPLFKVTHLMHFNTWVQRAKDQSRTFIKYRSPEFKQQISLQTNDCFKLDWSSFLSIKLQESIQHKHLEDSLYYAHQLLTSSQVYKEILCIKVQHIIALAYYAKDYVQCHALAMALCSYLERCLNHKYYQDFYTDHALTNMRARYKEIKSVLEVFQKDCINDYIERLNALNLEHLIFTAQDHGLSIKNKNEQAITPNSLPIKYRKQVQGSSFTLPECHKIPWPKLESMAKKLNGSWDEPNAPAATPLRKDSSIVELSDAFEKFTMTELREKPKTKGTPHAEFVAADEPRQEEYEAETIPIECEALPPGRLRAYAKIDHDGSLDKNLLNQFENHVLAKGKIVSHKQQGIRIVSHDPNHLQFKLAIPNHDTRIFSDRVDYDPDQNVYTVHFGQVRNHKNQDKEYQKTKGMRKRRK